MFARAAPDAMVIFRSRQIAWKVLEAQRVSPDCFASCIAANRLPPQARVLCISISTRPPKPLRRVIGHPPFGPGTGRQGHWFFMARIATTIDGFYREARAGESISTSSGCRLRTQRRPAVQALLR
jgi:hypothetical protein